MSAENTKFSNIVAAIDGSVSSLNAARFAISLAQKDGAEVTLLSIIHTAVGLGHAGKQEEWHRNERIKIEDLFHQIEQEAQKKSVRCKENIIETHMSIDGAIVNYAEEHKADLIVIGTSGMSELKKMLLGSVVTGVVSYATCPVLVIK